jgi:extradiol dioxygenase family protein
MYFILKSSASFSYAFIDTSSWVSFHFWLYEVKKHSSKYNPTSGAVGTVMLTSLHFGGKKQNKKHQRIATQFQIEKESEINYYATLAVLTSAKLFR